MSVTVGYPDIPGLVKYLTMSDIPDLWKLSTWEVYQIY